MTSREKLDQEAAHAYRDKSDVTNEDWNSFHSFLAGAAHGREAERGELERLEEAALRLAKYVIQDGMEPAADADHKERRESITLANALSLEIIIQEIRAARPAPAEPSGKKHE